MSLRVLITNNTLAERAGTELYVRDVACELLRRGHQVIAYSSLLGEVAEELRGATVAVTDRLDELSLAPHVIHGHHHLETMTALLRYPNVPAIYFCHGWLPFEEMPPKFPRILRYVAVDQTCKDRLIFEHGIAEDQVQVLANFVDLRRFKPRGPLPEKPSRALLLNNYAHEGSSLATIREACARFQITVDAVGHSLGNPRQYPESLLTEYDLVLAKGRTALEALAVGNAVITCDTTGVGPMVTPDNVEALRQLNFGIRTLRNPLCVETIAEEIARYNATQAAQVSGWIRKNASMGGVVDQLIKLYEDVIEKHRRTAPTDTAEEMRAASAYLRYGVKNPTAQGQANLQHGLLTREHQNLRQAYETICAELERLKESAAQVEIERNMAQLDLADIRRSSTIRLHDRLVNLPLIGPRMKSMARIAAARWGK